MLKRRLDERNNICKLTEIVSMEIGNKFSYDRINSHKPVEERFIGVLEKTPDKSIKEVANSSRIGDLMADSPKFNKKSERSFEIDTAARKLQLEVTDDEA